MVLEELPKKDKILYGEEEILHNINIGNMILDAFKSRQDFIGQIDAATGQKTTYRQMRVNSIKCALWLRKSGYRNIAICTRHQMLAYIPFLASIYIGGRISAWHEKYFEDSMRIMYFVAECEPQLIFVDKENYSRLYSAIKVLNSNGAEPAFSPKIITFGKVEGVDSLELILNENFRKAKIKNFSCGETRLMDFAALMFSPHATSYPGKVCIRYFAFTCSSNQEVPVMSPDDIGLWYGSLNWTHSLILTVRSIVSHVTVIKCSKFSEEHMYEMINKYKVSWVFLDSNMCNRLFQIDTRMYNTSSLKQLVFDSAIERDIYERLIEHFPNTSIIQVYVIPEPCIIGAYQRNNNRIGSSGHLAKNIQFEFVDPRSKKILGPNAPGEIWCRFSCKWCSAETCDMPYCINYRAEKDRIDKFMYAAITAMWHTTGTYGYYDRGDEIFIIDEVKNLIKYKTYYLSPLRIENVLQRHPAVSEVVVGSVPSYDGQLPVAYVKKKCGSQVTGEELMKFAEDNLPDIFKIRGGLYFRNEMPYLPNGKIDRVLVQYW